MRSLGVAQGLSSSPAAQARPSCLLSTSPAAAGEWRFIQSHFPARRQSPDTSCVRREPPVRMFEPQLQEACAPRCRRRRRSLASPRLPRVPLPPHGPATAPPAPAVCSHQASSRPSLPMSLQEPGRIPHDAHCRAQGACAPAHTSMHRTCMRPAVCSCGRGRGQEPAEEV